MARSKTAPVAVSTQIPSDRVSRNWPSILTSERESWAISRTRRKVSSHPEWLRLRRSLLQLLMQNSQTIVVVQSNREKECKVQASIKQGRRVTGMHASRFRISLKAQWWNLVRRLNQKLKSQNTSISQPTSVQLDPSRPQSVSLSTMVKVTFDPDPKVYLLYLSLVVLSVEATLECQGWAAADTLVKDMLGMKPSRTTSLLSRNAKTRKDRQRALTKVHDLDTLWTADSLGDLDEWWKSAFWLINFITQNQTRDLVK